MELNWTLEVLLNLVAIGIILTALLWFSLKIYRRNRFRYYTYFVLIEILYLIRFTFLSLGILFSSVFIHTIGWALLAVQLVLVILAANGLYRDTPSTTQITIVSVLAAVGVVLLLTMPGAAMERTLLDGSSTIVLNTTLVAVMLPPFFIAILLYFFLLCKLVRQAPQKLKKSASWGLLGYCLMGFVPATIVATGLSTTWLGSAQIVSGLGVLIMNYTFLQHPKLIFVLSFRVLRVTVLDTDSGLTIFTHTWHSGQSLINEELFAGMMQGVRVIMVESLNQGNVREVLLDNGIIILQRVEHTNAVCCCVATAPSQTLRDGLRVFAAKFYKQFGTLLSRPQKIDQFRLASALIDECFPFVPEYD